MSTKSALISDVIYIWKVLGRKHAWRYVWLLALTLLGTFSDMVTIGAILPFLKALTDPESIMGLAWVQAVLEVFGLKTQEEMILFVTVAFIFAAVFGGFIKVLQMWSSARLGASMGAQLRTEVYDRTLNRSYEFHIAHNSSRIISVATEQVGAVIFSGIMQMLSMIIALFTAIGVIVTLLIIDARVALITFAVFGGGYYILGYLSRRLIEKNGEIIARARPRIVKQLQEGIGGIRDVILDGSQNEFLKHFKIHVKAIHWATGDNQFYGQFPKSILNVMGVVLIAGLAYYLHSIGAEALPVLGALALGAQRLLPAMQQVYLGWSGMIGNAAAISEVVDYLKIETDEDTDARHAAALSGIAFKQTIELVDLGYRYPTASTDALHAVQMRIQKGMKIGLVGPTGCGKSTLIDIIMGLLTPTSGEMRIDGVVIDKRNVRLWQQHIAHVPQSIYLSDASVAENIAFGIAAEAIEPEKVSRAARLAEMDAFIMALPDQYETRVGERGVQLSGGQRQRIGIARALYKEADVIILDEATSALDDATEESVMEAINSLEGDLTVIMIAHRLSTLRECDTVYRLAKGGIAEVGSFEAICGDAAKWSNEASDEDVR